MNVLKNLNKYSIKNIDKINKVPGIEQLQTKSGDKVYGIRYYIFNKRFSKIPLCIRFTSKSKSFKDLNSIDIFNKDQSRCAVIELKSGLPEDKLLQFISRSAIAIKFTNQKFKKIKENNSTIEKYLSYLNENDKYSYDSSKTKSLKWEMFFLKSVTISSGIATIMALFILISFYIKVIRNQIEAYKASKLEEEINQNLFKGQKQDEPAFNIYSKLQHFVIRVLEGKTPAAIICGPPGTSKTYILRRVLHFKNLKPIRDYNIIKGGGLSIAAIYDLLYKNKDKILILDDFDTPLNNEDTINMLKAITDSYDRRILSISREKLMSSDAQVASSTPEKFEHTGKIIIITNIPKEKINRALLSRAPAIEVKFSQKEMSESIQKMLKFIQPDVPLNLKMEVYNYIIDLSKKKEIELDFRSFKNSIDARVANPDFWKEMVRLIVAYD